MVLYEAAITFVRAKISGAAMSRRQPFLMREVLGLERNSLLRYLSRGPPIPQRQNYEAFRSF